MFVSIRSKILAPRVGLSTSCFNWKSRQRSLVSKWLKSPAWFFGILCCRVQIFWHLFTILRPKAFRNHFSIWLVRGSEILNPLSRDLWFLHDFAEFYVAGFRFSDSFLQYRGLKPSEILNPASRDLSFLHDFLDLHVAGFRFSESLLRIVFYQWTLMWEYISTK
jgi:hypothetical protein